jgi:hypothetical protein
MCMLSRMQAHISHFTRSRALLSSPPVKRELKTECLPVPFALAHGMRGTRQVVSVAKSQDGESKSKPVGLGHVPESSLLTTPAPPRSHRNKPMQSFTLSSSAAGVRTDLASPNKLHAQFKRAALVEPIHP